MVRTFSEGTNSISLLCTVCKAFKTIATKDAQFAYTEINKFRGEHQHLEQLNRKEQGLGNTQ